MSAAPPGPAPPPPAPTPVPPTAPPASSLTEDPGSAYAFAVLDIDRGDRLIGRVALSNVVRGPWQNATLGYWIDKDALGMGHATRAVRLVLRFAFEHAGLHRVQPAIIPRNQRSVRVAEKAGFRLEGRALRYLKINGTWEDHDVYALTAEDWKAMGKP